MYENSSSKSKNTEMILKIVLTLAVPVISIFYLFLLIIFSLNTGIKLNVILEYISVFIVPVFLLTLIWFNNRKKLLKIWAAIAAVFIVVVGIDVGIELYDKSITVNTTPNIAVHEYLPFDENSKIVTLPKEASIKLTENLPIVDGAAAVFPVYSAFVNAFADTGTNITDYMAAHMTEEEKSFYFGQTADLIGYENLNVRITINKRDIIVNIPFTYTICGVVDTFSDRWDTGMLPLPSGFVTEENYNVYIGAQKKAVEKYTYFDFKPYFNLVFLSSEKNSPRELWEDCRNIINSGIKNEAGHIAAESAEKPHDLTVLRLNRFAYPSSSE
jgi:hypothetical protein